ncbi:MAG: hypothetical protein CVU56_08870 [Deltaproteobacteria bacterium HGW-Deltaproteobacteria-14]|jgi:hypothetical protein|nr:MAG: hypothetical protein CVU56_08870 [Deltaproteobacteria bacterium HGW-Deltaproteobacteria-14]
MSEPKLSDVLDRLDRLEAALNKLIGVVERQGALAPAPAPAPGRGSSPAAAVAAAAPVVVSGPPPIRVAPPKKAATPAAAKAAPAAEGDEPARDYDPYRDRTDLPVPPVDAGIELVLARVFEAALMEEAEDTWALMSKLTHSSQLRGPRSLDHFKAFAWHKLRRTAPTYLDDVQTSSSFAIAYTEPPQLAPEDDRVKVFVRTPDGRLPAPISFARDPEDGRAWRVTQLSL